jgi:nitroreductase
MGQTIIKLPSPQLEGKVSLEETILRRRSIRRYRREPLDLPQLSQILWSAQGITGARGFRAAPSAGATYPLEIFVVVGKQGVIASEVK